MRVLPHVYNANKEPVNKCIGELICQMDSCDESERNSLVQVLALIGKDKPSVSHYFMIVHEDYLYGIFTKPSKCQQK